MDEERRRHPRAEAHLEAKITVLPSTADIPSPTVDVSGGGLRLSVKRPLAPKQRISLELEIPGQKPISMYGEVVWSDQRKLSEPDGSCEIGVRIIQVGSAGRESIEHYVLSKKTL